MGEGCPRIVTEFIKPLYDQFARGFSGNMADSNTEGQTLTRRKPIYKQVYFWVLVGIVLGVLVGHFFPKTGQALEPIGESFINLILMVIAPIIFCTVVAGMADLKSVGRIGLKALVYFEILSTIALILGLVVINVVRPGTAPTPSRPSSRGTRPVTSSRGRRPTGTTLFSTSSLTASSAPSPTVTSCRCCSSRFWSPSPCSCWGRRGGRSHGR